MADDFKSARAAWFGQYGYGRFKDANAKNVWQDPSDNARNKSGLPQTVPGIALPRGDTLGHYYEVIAPNLKRMIVRQVDQGPGRGTGRGIDINAAAAEMAGYTPKSFPTNDTWKYRYIGEKLPSGTWEGLQVAAAQAASGPRQYTHRWWEQGRVAPEPKVAGGPLEITDVRHMLAGHGPFATKSGAPVGMIIHHTSGHEKDAQAVADELRASGKGVQYVNDRGPDGTGANPRLWRLIPEGETTGRGGHIMSGWGPKGQGLSNLNIAGVEIIADPTGESGPKTPVTPAQQALAGQLIGWHSEKYGYDPQKRVFGHGEVNPGHREAAEGMEVVSRVRAGTLPLTSTTEVAQAKWGTAEYWRGKAGGAQPDAVEVAKASALGPNARVAAIGADGKPQPASGKTQTLTVGPDGKVAQAAGDNAKVARAGDNAKVGEQPRPRSEPPPPAEHPKEVAQAEKPQRAPEPKHIAEGPKQPRPGTHAYWDGPKHAEAQRLAQGGDPQAVGSGDARSTLPRGQGGHQPVGDGTAQTALASTAESDTGEYAAPGPDTITIYAHFDSWPPV